MACICVGHSHRNDPRGQSGVYSVNKGNLAIEAPSNPLEGLEGLAYKNNGTLVVHRCW